MLVTNRLGPVGRGQKEDGETAGTSKCDLQTPRASGIFHLAAKSQLLRIWRACGHVLVFVTNRLGPVGRVQKGTGNRWHFQMRSSSRASGIFHLAAKSQLLCHRTYMESLWTRFGVSH